MQASPVIAAAPQGADADTAAVVIEGVDKHFANVQALRSLSARIQYGRLTGLVGPDGAGKTTLMRILTGLLVPNAGRVTLAGYDVVRDNDAIHVASGYMPQRFGLYEDLSVMENMRLYAQLRGMDADRNAELFAELLDFTRLGPFSQRLAGRLSGGMKQKLGLACALMARPKVLLLDEPGVGVDPVSRQDLWRMVQALTDQGMAVVWSTAYLDEAERCASVLLLNQGQLLFDGPPQELTAQLEGLLISSLVRNQFMAAQIALFSGFLPAFMLSGFLFEIDAMPAPIRAITRVVPARYFVDSLKTVFLAGDIWAVFLPNLAAMAAIGALFFALAKRATRKNLE